MALLGFVMSALAACVMPAFGYLFTEMLFLFMMPESPDYSNDRDKWIALLASVGVYAGLTGGFQKWAFTVGGENLIKTFRMKLYEGIIYKHVGWFDSKEKAPGVLSNILSEDIQTLHGMTTETYSVVLEAILTLCICIVVSFIFSWEMALITLAASPFVIVQGFIQNKLMWKR